jgi:hypothetical protein
MKDVLDFDRGYVGLLALLITVAIIMFLVWQEYELYAPTSVNSTNPEYQTQNMPGQIKAIDKAKDAKALLENRDRSMLDQVK